MGRLTRRLVCSTALVALLALVASSAPAASMQPHVMLGVYPGGSLQASFIIDAIRDIDAWMAPTGQRMMIAGDFIDLEFPNPGYNVPAELNGAWNAGYVPFMNLMSTRTGTAIAGGAIDTAVRTWARWFAAWSNRGQKRAFLAPLPEMNGNWTTYNSGGPTAFIAAYRRIRQIFEEELASAGVPSTAISWVFAPNGWSLSQDSFELYYPGDDLVDVVGFSAYNYGGCPPASPWLRWDTFELAMLPYLDRMRALAPGKPIFITQTGTLARPVNGVGDKDVWLDDTYTSLAAYPAVRGIIYYNVRFTNSPTMPNCPDADFRLHLPGTTQWEGFRTAMADPASNFGYYAPGSAELRDLVFARPARIFADVEPIHPLIAGEDGVVDWASWIHTLYAAGITTGCGTAPLRYCPDSAVTRGQMAVFLMRGIFGSGFTPAPATGTRFGDVPAGDPFAPWIEALAEAGITGGCGDGKYCPGTVVTRGQMAVFLLRAMHGAGFVPPAATGTRFGDVRAGDLFAPWIEALAQAGITGGCGNGNYCPDAPVDRAQMAVFLVRAFGL